MAKLKRREENKKWQGSRGRWCVSGYVEKREKEKEGEIGVYGV